MSIKTSWTRGAEFGVPPLSEEARAQLDAMVDETMTQAQDEILHRARVRRAWQILVTADYPWEEEIWHVRAEAVSIRECEVCGIMVEPDSHPSAYHRFGLYRMVKDHNEMYLCGLCLIGADPSPQLAMAVRTYWTNGTRRVMKMREMRPLITSIEWWRSRHPLWRSDPDHIHWWRDVEWMRRYILRGLYPGNRMYARVRNILTTPDADGTDTAPVTAFRDSMLAELLLPENFRKLSFRDQMDVRYIARLTKGQPIQSSELRRQVRRMFDEYILNLPVRIPRGVSNRRFTSHR